MTRKYLFLFLALVPILTSGCMERGFGPVAVPTRYMVKPPEPVDEADLTDQLLTLQNRKPEPYRITAGDRFSFSVYEHVEMNVVDLVVTPDGFISLPLVGPLNVGNKTLLEATDLIRDKMAAYIRNPMVSLVPYRVNGYNFTIAGRVNSPGIYPISVGKTHLLEAIALAHGLSQGMFNGDTIEMGDLENAYISRRGQILPVDFVKAVLHGDALNNIPIEDGDYIYIPSIMNTTVTFLGEVNSQTYIGFKEGMSVLSALPYAGGMKDTHSDELIVIRGGLKNPVVYRVNIMKMLQGKIADFPLQPYDVLYLPKDTISEWNTIVHKVLPTTQLINTMAGPFGNPSGYLFGND